MDCISHVPHIAGMSFEDWKIRMEIFLAAYNDNMYTCIIKGPFKFTKTIKVDNADIVVEKDLNEMTAEEIKLYNLDKVGRFIMTKALDNDRFDKVKHCKTAKEMWDKVRDMSEGNDAIKEHQLSVALEKLDKFKMKSAKTIDQMDTRFTRTLNEVLKLGKTFTDKEITVRVLKALPPKFNMKVTAMEESRDLGKISLTELFSVLKAYEYKLPRMGVEETSTSGPTAALVAAENPRRPAYKSKDVDSSDEATILNKKEYTAGDVALLMNNFKKFYRRKMKNKYNNASTSNPTSSSQDKDSYKSKMMCYNCRKLGHFIRDCPYPKAEKYTEEEKRIRKERKLKQGKVLSSDEENPALICLMAKESDNSEEDEVTPIDNELFDSFEQMMLNNTSIAEAYKKLKEEMILLKEQNSSLKLKAEKPRESAEYKQLEQEHESLKAECEGYKGKIMELEKIIESHDKSTVASMHTSSKQKTPLDHDKLELNHTEKFVSADNSKVILYVQTTKPASPEKVLKEQKVPKAKKSKEPSVGKQTGKTKQQSPKKSADKAKTNQISGKTKSTVNEQETNA
ncbi:hypothetical protein ACJIZ3_021644 [Penstemon smallii]|uniref:CCHC-type domain-containing protein n=1 Tax=Penstemon smallii TaxID=265156 RepID=A0ABD3SM91_9LAMI